MKRLLFDYFEPVKLELNEQEGGKVKVKGVFATAEKPTLNGRVYPIEVWEREVEKLQKLIKERKLFGELDHPEDGRTQLNRVSHLITDLRLEGNNVIGESEILDTDRGRNLKAIIKHGARVGVSSRGTGSTVSAENGLEKVQDDFELISFDFVASPADENAYPQVFFEEVRRKYMLEINLEELKKTRPDIVDAIKKEAENEIRERFKDDIAKIKAEVEEKTIKGLEEKFKKELADGIEKARSDIEKKVRDELQKEGKIDEAILDKVKAKLLEYQEQLRELGMKYQLQREYGARSDFNELVERMGDLKEYKTIGEMKDKAEKIVKELGEDIAATKVDKLEQKIVAVETENQKLKEALEKALQLAKDLGSKVEEMAKEQEKEKEKEKEQKKDKYGKTADVYLRELENMSSEFKVIKESLLRKQGSKSRLTEECEGLDELKELGIDVEDVVRLATK